ncbi:MAG TPA: gluconeogenesis factor YvcK family protein [Candidatus Saccharimonadales bacterium]|nr:gluconeogenesis factor YvcK family protein [Candidatus Saccharimonadales bacterium]
MNDPYPLSDPKIAVIGGGTGSFTLLSALKQYSRSIAALVNMADDGGSTGVLRDELGALPPGDVRQCLVALSNSPKVRDLFDYRFEEGTFKGHAFGNLLLSALEKMTGNFSEAIETASEILNVRGVVIPATLDDVRLKMEWPEASVILQGERVIDEDYFSHDPRRATLSLVPDAHANPVAIEAIHKADVVVIAPGDLYTSLGPLLVIDGIGEALRNTSALVIYVCNLVTKQGQTEGFTVADHADEIERLGGGSFLDYVLYNKQIPNAGLAARYKEEGAFIVPVDNENLEKRAYMSLEGNFLGGIAKRTKSDVLPVTRSFIRHNPEAIAKKIMELYHNVTD